MLGLASLWWLCGQLSGRTALLAERRIVDRNEGQVVVLPRKKPTSQRTMRITIAIQTRFMIAMLAWNRNQTTSRIAANTSNV